MTYNEEPSLKHEWENVVSCPECKTEIRTLIKGDPMCIKCGYGGDTLALITRRWVQTKSLWYFWLPKNRRGYWEYKDE